MALLQPAIENWIFPQAENSRPALRQITVLPRLDGYRGFAGSDYKTPIFEPEAKRLLCRIEPLANHNEVRVVQ
jgi:hypothetical protein